VRYLDKHAEEAHRLAQGGLTDAEIALRLGIDLELLTWWKRLFWKFRQAIVSGRAMAEWKGSYSYALGGDDNVDGDAMLWPDGGLMLWPDGGQMAWPN
jgi:hypothetical protein